MLFKVAVTCQSVNEIFTCAEQYFPVVLFIMLYMVVLTFESVDEIRKCDYRNEQLAIKRHFF